MGSSQLKLVSLQDYAHAIDDHAISKWLSEHPIVMDQRVMSMYFRQLTKPELRPTSLFENSTKAYPLGLPLSGPVL